jgi:hypothetical protein
MTGTPRFVVRPATDRPGFAVVDTAARHPEMAQYAVRSTRAAADQEAERLNEKLAERNAGDYDAEASVV